MKRARLKRGSEAPKKKRLRKISQLPAPPAGMKLLKIEKIITPHPYMITPKHLETGRMYLDESTLVEAEERHGAQCEICRKRVRAGVQDRVLSVTEHKKQNVLFMEVPKGDLNEIAGLKKYLFKIKPLLEKLKIDGVAFKQV